LVVSFLVGVTAAGCAPLSAVAPLAADARAPSTVARTVLPLSAPRECLVSGRGGRVGAPAAQAAAPVWFGTGALAVALPASGVVRARPAGRGVRVSLPWRGRPGTARVVSRWFHGPPTAVTAAVRVARRPAARPLDLPGAGCWRLTASGGGRPLRVTVWVALPQPVPVGRLA